MTDPTSNDTANADAAYMHVHSLKAAEVMIPVIAEGLSGAGIEPSPMNVAQTLLVCLCVTAGRAATSDGNTETAVAIMDQVKRTAITTLRIMEGKRPLGMAILGPSGKPIV